MMKLAKRAAALVLAAVLALSLTACSPKEVASNLILKTADLLGLREEGSDDDEADEIVAQPGGEVNFPDGLQDTSVHWNQQVQDGTLYVAFNSIQNRNTEYFVAGSDTVQVTGYGTTESTGILEFKVALWELSEDKATTSYVAGTTVYFPTGGECSTYTISGLTPGRLRRYWETRRRFWRAYTPIFGSSTRQPRPSCWELTWTPGRDSFPHSFPL